MLAPRAKVVPEILETLIVVVTAFIAKTLWAVRALLT